VRVIKDTASGFSATLVERLDSNGNGTGEFSLAIRLDGVVLDQMLDLYNYWKCLSTPQNHTYQAAEFVTLNTEALGLRAAYAISTAAGQQTKRPGISGPHEELKFFLSA
jgi:hypothetical protein